MIDELKSLLKCSYAPISNFRVSAIVLTKDGQKFKGVNVEDHSLRAGTCAERNAIYAAITSGVKKGDITSIHLLVENGKIGTPCFVCRQMIHEYCNKDTLIRCYALNGEYKDFLVSELCPYPFGEDDLN